MTVKRILAFMCLGILLTASGLALAQSNINKYGSGLDPQGIPYSSKYYTGQPEDNVIALVRKPELTEDQFILRITNPHVLNGCIDISDYSYFAEYRDAYLDISISGLTMDMRDQPQYAHFQCNQQTQVPVADIVLNRQDLIKNETRQLRLHNGADTNYYNISLSDNRVMILPDASDIALKQRFKPHEMPGRKTSLVYWFYPVGTMLLWVPGMEKDQDSAERLQSFAKSKGLVPLQTLYPGFESPLKNTAFHYYVDTSGRFDAQKAELAQGAPIGAVSLEKTVYGLEKDEIVLDQKTVYAKLPGMYE